MDLSLYMDEELGCLTTGDVFGMRNLFLGCQVFL